MQLQVASQCVLQRRRLVGILVDCRDEGVAVKFHGQLQLLLKPASELSNKTDASSMMSRCSL